MKTKNWVVALLMASALCAACDNKKEAAAPAEKQPEIKPGAPSPMTYDTNMIHLAHSSNCFSCHTIDNKVIGPAFKEVAAKYRGDASAEDNLVAKVSKGSSGVWGSVPMPASSPAVKEADIRTLVKFILSLN